MNSIWLDIVDLLCQHVETIGSVLLFTFALFGIYRYGLQKSKRLLLLIAGILLFKYVAAILAVSLEFGSLDLTGGLTGFVVALVIEITIIALIVFLACRMILPKMAAYEAKKGASAKLNCELDEKPIYPLSKLFSLKNPIQRILFIGISIILLWRLAAALISEFTYGMLLQPGDIPVILIYWFLLILLPCFYSYFLALLFFKLCDKQNKAETSTEKATDKE